MILCALPTLALQRVGQRLRWIMANAPELEIDFTLRGVPVAARCSICRAEMPPMKAKGASAEELLRWFSIQLGLHSRAPSCQA